MCQRSNTWLINLENNNKVHLDCKAYSCPECGPHKRRQLYRAILKNIEGWKFIRMWTFTISGTGLEPKQHYNILRSSWRYLITYLRRSAFLTKHQRQFQFIKIVELHDSDKSGKNRYKGHLHVFINEYFDWHFMMGLWTQIVQDHFHALVEKAVKDEQSESLGIHLDIISDKLENHKKFCHCNVEFVKSQKHVAHYVVKYVTKQCQLSDSFTFHKYSKSGGMKFFEYKKCSLNEYAVLKANYSHHKLNLIIVSKSSQLKDHEILEVFFIKSYGGQNDTPG